MKKQFIAIFVMLAVMLSACSNKEMPVLDGKYYIESFHDEKIVFQSVDTHKKVEALLEDQTMFYKALLRSVRSMVVADAYYVHQDAKTSRKNKPVVTRCLIINRIIFWHRFIYSMECSAIARAWARLCFAYRMCWLRLWALIDWARGRNRGEDVRLIFRACKDGWDYVKSEEYAALPAVYKGEV